MLTSQDKKLTLSTNSIHVAGSVGLYGIKFTYDSEWDNITTKVVVFNSGCVSTPVAVEDTGGEITIPWETIQQPCILEIGVLGYITSGTTHTLQITTTAEGGANLVQILPMTTDAVDTTDPAPTPSIGVWEQLRLDVGTLSQLTTTDKSSLVNAINEVAASSGGGTIQTVKRNGVALPVVDATVDITVPTKTSDLTNDSTFATSSDITTAISTHNSSVTAHDDIRTTLASKASQSDVTTLTSTISGVEAKIPTQATSENQLADKNFVNSSIATNTANYISNNGEPFTSVAQLEAYSGTVTNNDYAFVTGSDETNTWYDRYKATVSGSSVTWSKEYRLNNSSFTANQWAAINSGITGTEVAQIATNTTAIEGKVDKVTGKGLSTNDYTTADKDKLDGVASGAQVNMLEGVQINSVDQTISNKKVNLPSSLFTFTMADGTQVTYRIVGGAA